MFSRAARVTATAANVKLDPATVVFQLFNNSVHMVGSSGGEKKLPGKDSAGTYHIDGSLAVADKTAVKCLVSLFGPLGGCRKIFLGPSM